MVATALETTILWKETKEPKCRASFGNQDIQTTKQSGYDQKNRNNDFLGPKRCDQCNKVNFVFVWMHREIHNNRMILEFREAQRNAKINGAKINSVNLNKEGNSV